MISLVMQENAPPDRIRGWRRVEIEPSKRAPLERQTVRMHVNDHFEQPTVKDEDGAREIVNILSDRFDQSMLQSKQIVSQLMDFASKLR
jgi:hypothetical protein